MISNKGNLSHSRFNGCSKRVSTGVQSEMCSTFQKMALFGENIYTSTLICGRFLLTNFSCTMAAKSIFLTEKCNTFLISALNMTIDGGMHLES